MNNNRVESAKMKEEEKFLFVPCEFQISKERKKFNRRDFFDMPAKLEQRLSNPL